MAFDYLPERLRDLIASEEGIEVRTQSQDTAGRTHHAFDVVDVKDNERILFGSPFVYDNAGDADTFGKMFVHNHNSDYNQRCVA